MKFLILMCMEQLRGCVDVDGLQGRYVDLY